VNKEKVDHLQIIPVILHLVAIYLFSAGFCRENIMMTQQSQHSIVVAHHARRFSDSQHVIDIPIKHEDMINGNQSDTSIREEVAIKECLSRSALNNI